MKPRIAFFLVIAAMALAGGLAANVSHADETPATASSPTINDLAFLSGGWSGEMFGGVGEEYWSPPNGGSIVGAFRLIQGGKTTMTEYLLVIEEDDGVFMRFKHFNNDYTTWEKEAPNTFKLTEVKNNRAVFIAPSSEQKLGHLIYRLEGDTLYVKVGATQDIENNTGAMSLKFERKH